MWYNQIQPEVAEAEVFSTEVNFTELPPPS